MPSPILSVRDLRTYFQSQETLSRAVDGVSYSLTFCLGSDVENWVNGPHTATPNGVE